MAKMICLSCNLEFPSDSVYLHHKKGDHKTQLEKGVPIEAPPVPTPPPGVPAESMPTPEFMAMVDRIESKDEKPAESSSTPSQHPSSLPDAKPINLTYRYEGECKDCRTPISTLEIDVSKNHFVIAFCKQDNKQLESREVAKL